jgi:signal transduction histidine kinase
MRTVADSQRARAESTPDRLTPDLAPLALPRSTAVSLSQARIELTYARALGGFGLVFGAQVLPSIVAQQPDLRQPWGAMIAGLILGGLVWVAVTTVLRRGIVIACTVVALAYLLALASWPLLVRDPSAVQSSVPWLWYLCTVATGFAALALSVRVAAVYTVLTPLSYGLVRVTPAGGGASPTVATLDAIYALILGGAILAIFTMLRQASVEVEAAQRSALTRYRSAVREHATDAERGEVDAIVHDSVLTTLLMAAAAETPREREIVARMASNAIGQIDGAVDPAPADGAVLEMWRLGVRIAAAAEALPVPFDVVTDTRGYESIPAGAGEALIAAATQAMVNSSQHAGDASERSVVIEGGQGGVAIGIVDDGHGFDPDSVPHERLGVRVSIKQRLARAGGVATVLSAPGRGTTVFLRWPAPDPRREADPNQPDGYGS